jgi:lysozyme
LTAYVLKTIFLFTLPFISSKFAPQPATMPKKRNLLYRRFTVVMLLFIAGLLGYFLYDKIRGYFNRDYENNFTLYPGFGIQMPDDFAIHGIDVSKYQKRINWPMVKQMKEKDIRLGFAFMKATEGVKLVDAEFKRNWTKTKANNLPRGAYHFFIAYKSGKQQANHFIKTVMLEPGDLPPVLDVETLNGASVAEMQKNVAEWLEVVENHYGVKPIIYSNASFYNNYLENKFSEYPLWVAHYLERNKPRVNRHWHFWQHNESGYVNGIDGFVDFNVFNGDTTDFKTMLLK